MRVRYTPRAASDLAKILEYLDQKSPQGSLNVKRAIQNSIDTIGQFPGRGERAGIREVRVIPVKRYPYLIYWTVEAAEIWLLHIRHAARQSWKRGQ